MKTLGRMTIKSRERKNAEALSSYRFIGPAPLRMGSRLGLGTAAVPRFREERGTKSIAAMRKSRFKILSTERAQAAQRNFKKAMRGFLDHCLSLKMIRTNPLVGLKLVKAKTIGHHPWEAADAPGLKRTTRSERARGWPTSLLLQAGQSRCDVVRMGRQHIRNGMMSMGRQKTGVPFNVEIMPRLQAAIGAMPGSNHLTFLVTAQGKPFMAVRQSRPISQSRTRPITSSWPGWAGHRSRRRRSTQRRLTES